MTARLSISNIAWPASEDDAALAFAARLGFAGLEIAPAKVFGSLDAAGEGEAGDYRRRAADAGLAIAAMQAILFGVEGVHLFASEGPRTELARRLTQVAVLAGQLGGVPCVFGAPKLRDPGAHDAERAFDIARDFFGVIAPVFASEGARLCFEANPAVYGCRFMTHTTDAVRLVDAVDHAGFGLQFDSGTVFINAEDIAALPSSIARADHFHISEPHLAPLGTSAVDHRALAEAVRTSGYAHWLSVEMKEAPDWRQAMSTAYGVAEAYTRL